MGEMRDSDWSRPNLLRSDWLPIIGAIMTTEVKQFAQDTLLIASMLLPLVKITLFYASVTQELSMRPHIFTSQLK